MYHYGVWGVNNDGSGGFGTRSGGVMGSTTVLNTFGALAYTASNLNVYGIYYTAGTSGNGGGFLPSNSVYGIGEGGTGGVIGSWTRGAVMGQVSCGELFASYNLGDVYKRQHHKYRHMHLNNWFRQLHCSIGIQQPRLSYR